MKASLGKHLAWVLRIPLLGRFARMLLAVWRAPANHSRLLDAQRRLDTLETAGHARRDALSRLIDTVADISHRQSEIDNVHANLVKSVPVSLRRMERLRAEAEARIADVETSLSKLGTEMDELKATEDNRRSIDARVEEHAKNLSYLLERVEFVRSELLFELRYGSGKDVAASAEDAIPVVKIELPQSDVKVNLGCGHLPLQGYVNVDNRDLPTVDVVADVMKLPFDRGSVSEFFSSHFLEHFPEERLRRKVLPYLLSLLQPGGQFRAVVPDAEAMIQRYVAGTYPYEDLKDVIYGGQDYDGDFHFTMFTPASISSLLQEIGFAEVAVAHSGRVNGRALELEVHAIRPTEDK